MARPHAPPTDQSQWPSTPRSNRRGGFQFQNIPIEVVEVSNVQAGMVNRMPRDQVPQGSGRIVYNARIRDDWVGRRPGTRFFGPAKPDADTVLALVTFVSESGTVFLCRLTTHSFHVLSSSRNQWIKYDFVDQDGNPGSFSGIPMRFSFAQFFDRLYIADSAVHRVWQVDFTANRVKELPDAPRGKYIATFADRIIVANLRENIGGPRPSGIRWSRNGDPEDWDHVSAGFEDLAATNIGDEITGLFALEEAMMILRRRSIWIAERQPFAAAPFRFVPILNDIGCDLPHTAVKIPGGVIFADQRTREVYVYTPGGRPEPIAAAINRDLYEDLGELEFAQGAYDPFENEYHLGLTTEAGGITHQRTWVFSLEKGAWSMDDSPIVSCIGVVSLPRTSPTIDELIGIIDDQNPPPTGTIDDYAGPGGFRPTLFKGTTFGEVLEQTYEAPDDEGSEVSNEGDGPEGEVSFAFRFRSPNLGSLTRRRSSKDLELTTSSDGGTAKLFYLRSEAEPLERLHEKLETLGPGRRILRLPKKGVTDNDIFWELETKAPRFRLYTWWIRLLDKGVQRG